jgi:anti-anti-sigma regulatory factor
MPEPTTTDTVETVVLTAAPYLSGESGENLEREHERHLRAGRREFVIDFGRTEMVNSIGISVLIGMIEKTRDRGGMVRLANLNRVNREIFTVMGLLRHAPPADRETPA